MAWSKIVLGQQKSRTFINGLEQDSGMVWEVVSYIPGPSHTWFGTVRNVPYLIMAHIWLIPGHYRFSQTEHSSFDPKQI